MVNFAVRNARLTDSKSKYSTDNHSLDRAKKAPKKVRAEVPFADPSDNAIHDYVGLATHAGDIVSYYLLLGGLFEDGLDFTLSALPRPGLVLGFEVLGFYGFRVWGLGFRV